MKCTGRQSVKEIKYCAEQDKTKCCLIIVTECHDYRQAAREQIHASQGIGDMAFHENNQLNRLFQFGYDSLVARGELS